MSAFPVVNQDGSHADISRVTGDAWAGGSLLRRSWAALDRAVRYRYLVLAAGTAAMTGWSWHVRPSGLDDWLWFEFGARSLAHAGPAYTDGLHVYAQHPALQVGPPPLALIAVFQWLSPVAVRALFVALMAASGVLLVWCAEKIATAYWSTAGQERDGLRIRRMTLAVGLPVTMAWSAEVTEFQHLDDVMAIVCTTAALALIVRRGNWWGAALLIGVGMASKPWALIAAPMLLGLPRANRARSALVAMGAATACWAPFLIADHGTLGALGAFRLPVASTSTLSTLGLAPASIAPDWVRPVQLAGGFVLSWWLARQNRLSAVLFIGLLFRTVTDPQAWGYYGLGPLAGAFIWELSRGRRIPILTLATGVITITGQAEFAGQAAILRLVLMMVATIVILRARPDSEHQGVTTHQDEEGDEFAEMRRLPVATLLSG